MTRLRVILCSLIAPLDSHLKSILNATLAIPMADRIPTPNARKSCALAILLLQFQRLPEAILLPARDRIALALKRGICGELGKEGKKGSANDGLKVCNTPKGAYTITDAGVGCARP